LRYRLLDLLACPMCRHFPLTLVVFKERREEDARLPGEPPLCEEYCGYMGRRIKELEENPPCGECIKHDVEEGLLFCPACGRWYPIMNGIPRMLPDDLRPEKEFEEFLEKHWDQIPEDIRSRIRGKQG
jgi:uncharacterized protein YbaR (Trm112 family)